MLKTLFQIITIFSTFCATDRILSRFTNLQGIYYLIHAAHNSVIVYLTTTEVYSSLTDFNSIQSSEKNLVALAFVFALHFYHIAIYKDKFRYDDWLHHGLMIGIALPIGWIVDSRSLLGYSLFFTTGLPGGIDYAMLFWVRNGWLNKNREKQINAWLNTWIRSPGCVSNSVLTLAYTSTQNATLIDWILTCIVSTLTYWNGQYFMRQIVENNAIINNSSQPSLHSEKIRSV